MPRHLQRKDSDTSSNISVKERRHHSRILYDNPKPAWLNPCDQKHHFFTPKDLDGAPNQNTSPIFDARRKKIQYTQDLARMTRTNMVSYYFKDINKDDFIRETAFYRVDTLPELIKASKEHFIKKKLDEALLEAYKFLMYYKAAINLISCDNMLYPTKFSKLIMNLEAEHLMVICDLELTYHSVFGKPIPGDAIKKEAYEFKMFVCESPLGRVLRQYFILRDYIDLLEYMYFIYVFYSQ